MNGNGRATARPDPKVATRLSSSGNPISNANDDANPILMEAKLLETVTSLRQLISSNLQLEESLRKRHDDDLLQALEENESVILRKHVAAVELADKLRGHGVNVSLDDKVPRYDGSSLLREKKAERDKQSSSNGMYL